MNVSQTVKCRLARILTIFCFAVFLLSESGAACTTFCLKDDDNLVFGRNYDWHLDLGLVVVNKKNVAKRALLIDPQDTPARWISKYGSVTFNQYGRELPCGGMNEAGLVLETMWLAGTAYPIKDERPAVMAWVQYQLDTCATIEDVIASDKKIRVTALTPMPLHFLGCDREGNVATFEFLNGKMVCHRGDSLPVTALANDTYDKSLEHLKKHAEFGGTKKLPYGSWGSLDRFVCAADRVKKYSSSPGGSIVEYAFDTLKSVGQGDSTKWLIVYDPRNMKIHYQTCTCKKTRTIDLSGCDFESQTPVQVISINTAHTGLLNPYFSHYDTDLNRWLVYYSMKHTPMLGSIPDARYELLIQYPDAPTVQYLNNWEMAGPYTQEGKKCRELFDIAFDPERPDSEVQWRPLPMNPFAENPVYLDLQKMLKDGAQMAGYLRAPIESDRQTPARLEIFSDDGMKVWLNGELIHTNNVLRGISLKPDAIEVTLKKGTNVLMLKVTQDTGSWGAIVRLVDR
ncbi:MAG: linear amide C-N hydrolase [Sedimentisphaerales bacterium]|nr:linear amide C-N hydrolase [Sedimentisphaerales bacterium]